jgi:tRNA(Ile)-lysidine synthase
MSTVERTLLDAVRDDLARHDRVVLAISGGVDSMTLLDAARRVIEPGRIVVATFDHGTGESARAAAELVRARAAVLGMTCEAERTPRALRSEAELRGARWDFLRDVAAQYAAPIATAHTADDEVETVLMRVMRGTGPRGLAALHAPGGPLRPLLELSRANILCYAHAHRLDWVEDPSNESRQFFRNRIRHDLLPALREVRPELTAELEDIAKRAAAWRRDVDSFVGEHIRVSPAGGGVFEVLLSSFAGIESSHLRMLWPSVVARFGLMLDRRGIARLADFSTEGRAGSRIQLSGGWSVARSRDTLTFSASSHVTPPSATIDVTGQTRWGAWSFRPSANGIAESGWSSRLPSNAVLTVRAWAAGDKMRSPRGTIRKVKQLLSRAGVTGHKRAGWPVVLAGEEIVWIPGVRGSNITERLGTAGVPFICEFIDS